MNPVAIGTLCAFVAFCLGALAGAVGKQANDDDTAVLNEAAKQHDLNLAYDRGVSDGWRQCSEAQQRIEGHVREVAT